MCNTCSDADEFPVLTALQQPDAKKHGIPKLQRANQWDRSSRLTPEKIAAIEDKIKKGHLTLPECKPNQLWAMGDSGSSIKVADHAKHFPGAKLRENEASRKGLKHKNADGSPLPNKGEFDVDVETDEGHERRAAFQTANVTMPILSVRRLVRKGCRAEFFDGGGIIHLPDGQNIDFVERFGVYFVHLIVEPPDGTTDVDGKPTQVFSGPGA